MSKACYTCPILNKFKYSQLVLVKALIIQLHKNSSRARRIVPCGITEGNDKVNNHFRKFAIVSKGDNTCNLLVLQNLNFYQYICSVYSVSYTSNPQKSFELLAHKPCHGMDYLSWAVISQGTMFTNTQLPAVTLIPAYSWRDHSGATQHTATANRILLRMSGIIVLLRCMC